MWKRGPRILSRSLRNELSSSSSKLYLLGIGRAGAGFPTPVHPLAGLNQGPCEAALRRHSLRRRPAAVRHRQQAVDQPGDIVNGAELREPHARSPLWQAHQQAGSFLNLALTSALCLQNPGDNIVTALLSSPPLEFGCPLSLAKGVLPDPRLSPQVCRWIFPVAWSPHCPRMSRQFDSIAINSPSSYSFKVHLSPP